MNNKKISTVLGSAIVSTRINYNITHEQFKIFLDSERNEGNGSGSEFRL